jgi:hypothetical protein
MSTTYLATFQTDDSAATISQPPLDVPAKIEIKLERPAIKKLDTPDNSRNQPPPQTTPAPPPQAVIEHAEPSDIAGKAMPDTLDHRLFHDWQSSGYQKNLLTSENNDSTCRLPRNYFDLSSGNQGSQQKVASEKPSAEANDSVALGETALNHVEEIEIIDPVVATQKNFDTPLLGQTWFLVILITLVTITGLVRLRWQKYLSDIFTAVAFTNVANKLRSTTRNKKQASFWVGFLFYANFSLLLFETIQISQSSFFNLGEWQLLVVIYLFLLVIFSLKGIVYQFVGWVFNVQAPTSEYLSQSSVMSKAFGLILLPLIVLFPFLDPETQQWVPKIGLTIFILLYVMQIGRGMSTNLRNTLSGYYIILYLCALEILPLSILYKVLFY